MRRVGSRPETAAFTTENRDDLTTTAKDFSFDHEQSRTL
jgi:hypothetical protein